MRTRAIGKVRTFCPVAVLAAATLSSCGGDGGSGSPAPFPSPTTTVMPPPGPSPSPTPTPTPSPAPSSTPSPSPTATPSPTPTPTPTPAPSGWYKPSAGITWQWQLQGSINTSYDVALYDIDLFDVPSPVFSQLHSRGIRVLSYFSAGSYEEFRSDAGQFPSAVLGNRLDDWPGERWLDIRANSVREIMKKRLDHARDRGCDGVEPDNVDGYSNNTGFPLTASDQLNYLRFLATEAHARGLAIALKNNVEQVSQLVGSFDLAVNEQCFQHNECNLLKPFIDAGKPVLNAEYRAIYRNDPAARAALCQDSLARGFSTLVLPLDLDDSFRFSCR